MDINKMLVELRAERAMIDETMLVLARLGQSKKRRGRPPKWLTAASEPPAETPVKRRGRPPGSKKQTA